MQVTRDWTERPHGALLQLEIESRWQTHRIGGRLRDSDFGCYGANVGIPPFCCWDSNAKINNLADHLRQAV